MDLCKYRDIFGKPDEGVHGLRLGGVAVIDFAFTLGAALLTTYATMMPWPLTTVLWILLSIFVHYIFCVDTATMRYLQYGY